MEAFLETTTGFSLWKHSGVRVPHRCGRRPVIVRRRLASLSSLPWDGGDEKSDENEETSSRSDDGSRDIEFVLSENNGKDASKDEEENELFDVIKSTPPSDLILRFTQNAPQEVQQAFKVTLRNMLGSLPPLLYRMSVRTVTANLVQLMQSCLMNGYMLRNVQYRMSISKSLDVGQSSSLLLEAADKEGPRIVGDGRAVFTNVDGTETSISIAEYVSELKDKVQALTREVNESKKGTNEIIRYVANMAPENLEQLTSNAGPEVVEAMRRLVVAVTESQKLPTTPEAMVETPTLELGQLLFWLMVSGYFLREAEVRFDMKRALNPTLSLGGGDDDTRSSSQ